MKIVLCDLNPKLVAEWQRSFGKFENFSFYNEDILEFNKEKINGLVVETTSFGFLDNSYMKKFSQPDPQKLLQTRIKGKPLRELLIGESMVIPTSNKTIPYLICAPTHRVPLDISGTANSYLAFKATLVAAEQNNLNTIICPGLGLNNGISPKDVSLQMLEAYKNFSDKYPSYPASIRESYLQHVELVGITNIKKK